MTGTDIAWAALMAALEHGIKALTDRGADPAEIKAMLVEFLAKMAGELDTLAELQKARLDALDAAVPISKQPTRP